MNFTAIVAMDRARGIGRAGTLPWHLSADLKYFARITKGALATTAEAIPNTVIMGRKTWDSIPQRFRPLAARTNIVISRQTDFQAAGCTLASSLEQALTKVQEGSDCFVIGGAMIYTLALQHPGCTQLLITEIDAEFDCEVFFPPLDTFVRVTSSEPHHEQGLTFRFCRWQRR